MAAPAAAASAPGDICVVKLLVGPGHAGPAGAPSTTQGIGVEVWLPGKTAWNKRLRVLGGAGMAGGPHTNLTMFAGGFGVNPWDVAGIEGAVSATTDTGHSVGTPAFLMNPDGTINTVGWDEFAQRGIHEMTLKAKLLVRAYFGADTQYSYWQGGSTGGRPPIPGEALKYQMLTDWVEKGVEPGRVDVNSAAVGAAPAKGMAMCVYPQMPSHVSGSIFSAASYSCR